MVERIATILTSVICSQIAFRGWCSNMCVKAAAGREWKERGSWWAMQHISRKRWGGWEEAEVVVNTVKRRRIRRKKVNGVRRRSGGRRAVRGNGGEKMGVWPSEALEQHEQSSGSQSNYFFLLVLKPAWISSPPLPRGQPDVTSEPSRSEPQMLHSLLFPLKTLVEKHYCGSGDICWLNKKL